MRHVLFSDLALLKSHISLPNLPKKLPPHEVGQQQALLTGATGFIGGFLLKEFLLNRTFEEYVCIVRAENPAAGLKRLQESLLTKGLPAEVLETANIRVVVGDVLLPRFGLEAPVYNALLRSVDHLFHFAASMNWVIPFGQDAIANISSVKEAVSFCSSEKLKNLHYASSMGIWTLLEHESDEILETDLHKKGHELPGGYFQSKWVNENVLGQAKLEGLPINIYRIGDVKGAMENGLGDPNNFGNMVMQYFLESGAAIDLTVPEFNFLPVDFLAKSIAHISIRAIGQTFQFSNPELVAFRHIYEQGTELGYEMELMELSEWLEKLQKDPHPIAKTLRPIFRSFTPDPAYTATSFYKVGVDMFQKKHNTSNTESVLAGGDISCPAMLSDGVLQKYLLHLGAALVS